MTTTGDPLGEYTVRLAAAGDEAALGRVLAALHTEVVDAVRRSRVPPSDTDDAVQDCVLLIMRCCADYQPARGLFRPYVLTSVWKQLRRYRCRVQPTPLDVVGEPLAPDDARTVADEVDDLLGVLPTAQADVVRDYYGLGGRPDRNINQIAALRGLTRTAVRADLAEAFVVLRREATR